ncbi:hypothetical protein [Rheinheimera sp. MMS21-TC3]|uniref:hypothetical protein n=1 Tax=Rheinheimera sp. MMS21-TC3 TaxID=3072790 RepID=UPI0028C3D038|nr:hypothetical protein [Rheinheimera sp. MMS21-TC3]WNO61244.1 hypothetical protein RDV63_09865 [Rheinheimera sp. MMS21-TC3]
MAIEVIGKSNYTKQVLALIAKIYDNTVVADSVYEQAIQCFSGVELKQKQQIGLEQQVQLFESRLAQGSAKDSASFERQYQQAKAELKEFNQQLSEESFQRFSYLKQICITILQLTRGDSSDETLQLTAKMLGTIQLSSPTEGRNVALINQKSKHLYKAVLSLLLLDKLLFDNDISNEYILQRAKAKAGDYNDFDSYHPFRDDVQIPLLMAAILQDIGSCHPEVQKIIYGNDGKADPFRVMDNAERTSMLQVSYSQTLKYVTEQLEDSYQGNSKVERKTFIENSQQRKLFMQQLLKGAIKAESGIGNLLKIPQVYTSVVLSTKPNFVYETLPRVSLVLEKGVEKGVYSNTAVKSLLAITGIFPQGFGITYIPKDSDDQDLDRYEYAIVTGLYPKNLHEPACRMVTRNLTYNVSAQGCIVSVGNNLYYPTARKKLAVISQERLLEIFKLLVSNYEERKNMSLLPKCWHPDEYFSYVKNQNLWNRVVMHRN